MIINIVSGECLKEALQRKYNEDVFVPFNEAMMEGCPQETLFSDDFIKERCFTHQVSTDIYLEKMDCFLKIIKQVNKNDEIILWFGKDMFCQINELTVLAYLKQQQCFSKVYTKIINEQTLEIIQNTTLIEEEDYFSIYQNVIFKKENYKVKNWYLQNGINRYLLYHDKNSDLRMWIRNHKDQLEVKTLIKEVWQMTRTDGLGDTQVFHLLKEEGVNI